MNFQEIDELVGSRLENRFGSTERRDYRVLENKKPELFKGYGDKRGLMYLTVVSYDLYIDVNITDKVILSFRKDDDKLITVHSDFDNLQYKLDIFITLIDEYIYVIKRFNNFNSGIVPQDLIRLNKINKILDEV
jgi:hypothetical protein